MMIRCPDHPAAYGNGYLPEHRYVMECALGRFLRRDEKVTHLNGDQTDNRLENLRLVPPKPKAERFWDKVVRSEGCWEWRARRQKQGYGIFWVGRKAFLAHRVSYELSVGPIPAGQCVCHRCDNPPCVNPAHLFLGTQLENMADMKAKGRSQAILSPADVEEIKRLQADGMYQRDIAARFGVCVATVLRAAPNGKRGGRRGATARKGTAKVGTPGNTEFAETIDAVFSHADIQAARSPDVLPLFPITGATA